MGFLNEVSITHLLVTTDELIFFRMNVHEEGRFLLFTYMKGGFAVFTVKL